jgi:hypothetical protein
LFLLGLAIFDCGGNPYRCALAGQSAYQPDCELIFTKQDKDDRPDEEEQGQHYLRCRRCHWSAIFIGKSRRAAG